MLNYERTTKISTIINFQWMARICNLPIVMEAIIRMILFQVWDGRLVHEIFRSGWEVSRITTPLLFVKKMSLASSPLRITTPRNESLTFVHIMKTGKPVEMRQHQLRDSDGLLVERLQPAPHYYYVNIQIRSTPFENCFHKSKQWQETTSERAGSVAWDIKMLLSAKAEWRGVFILVHVKQPLKTSPVLCVPVFFNKIGAFEFSYTVT